MQKHDRISPWAKGRSHRSLCSGLRDHFEQMHVAFVGREDIQRVRPQQRVTGLLERDCAPEVRQAEAAEFGRDVRRKNAHLARLRHQFAAERVGRAVLGAARIGLQRDDFARDELADPLLQVPQPGRNREIH